MILSAATKLFVEHGYGATTISGVAAAADVAERTIYGRFGSKAALFKRVLDVATVGDDAPVDVLRRDWMQGAFQGGTLDGRIAAFAGAGRQIMERTGDLLAVAFEAAVVEPAIAAQIEEGRQQTRRVFELMWRGCAEDGLVRGVDLGWLVDTTFLIASPQTYLQTRSLGWTIDKYEAWLRRTFSALVDA